MNNSRNRWITFLSAWILGNGFGWFLIYAIYISPVWIFPIALGVGFCLSLFQWIVLQNYISMDSSWIWLSTPTYGIFHFLLFYFNTSVFSFLMINMICLGLLGLLQRSALAYYLDNTTLWIVASPFASIVGTSISRVVNSYLANQSFALFLTLSGILYGCITGIVIISLRNSTASHQKDR